MTVNYCSNCGEPLKEYAIVCSNCGKPVPEQSEARGTKKESANAYEEKVNAEQVCGKNASKSASNQTKNTFFAAILSFFMTGLGQVYNGQFWKGIFFMVATLSAAFLVIFGFMLFIIPGLIFFAIYLLILGWSMYDAYTEAEKINKGELPYKEPTVWEIIGFLLLPILAGFAIVFISVLFFMMIAIPFASV